LHVLPAGLLLDIIAQVAVGRKRMGFSRGMELTTFTALREVHRMSLSAFTSMEVLM